MTAMLDLAQLVEVSPALHAQAPFFAGNTALLQGDYATHRTLLESSAALWRTLDDQLGLSLNRLTNS
jgi:hypothetical protein